MGQLRNDRNAVPSWRPASKGRPGEAPGERWPERSNNLFVPMVKEKYPAFMDWNTCAIIWLYVIINVCIMYIFAYTSCGLYANGECLWWHRYGSLPELVAEQIELWKSRRKDEKFTSWTPISWPFAAISEGKILLICPDMSGTSSLNQALVDISGTSSTTNPRVIGIDLIEHPYYSRSESTTRYPPTGQSGDHWCKIPWRTLEYRRWVWVESHRDVEGSRGVAPPTTMNRIKLTKLETSTVTAKITRNRWRWNHGWLYTSNWDMMDIYWSHGPSIMMNKQSI